MSTLFRPGTILLVLANLLPLAGVVWWGWDAFLLLILYWCETVVIAFWTIVAVVIGPTRTGKNEDIQVGPAGRLALGAFISVHAGIFISVHFLFLWVLFSGVWGTTIHGPAAFVRQIILGTDLWIPLVVLFLVRGALIMGPRIRRRLGLIDDVEPSYDGNPLIGLYIRIFVMQVTIIVGGWFAMLAGDTIGPLVLLVLLKIVAEVFLDPLVARTRNGRGRAGVGAARTPAD